MGSITEIISFSSVHTEIPLTFEECDGKRTKQPNADESQKQTGDCVFQYIYSRIYEYLIERTHMTFTSNTNYLEGYKGG